MASYHDQFRSGRRMYVKVCLNMFVSFLTFICLVITLHIRAVGEWTNRLYDHFDRAQTMSIKDFIKNYQEPAVINMTALSPSPYVSVDVDPTPAPLSFDARVEAIKNDHLATRTLILPIPEDCDEN